MPSNKGEKSKIAEKIPDAKKYDLLASNKVSLILNNLDEPVEIDHDGQPKDGYKVDCVSPLYSDGRGMLLQPKKKKEYRYSRDLTVL